MDSLTTQQTALEQDVDSPFSYVEWKNRNAGYDTNAYSKYLVNWFSDHKANPVSKKFVLRQKYLYMLNQLQLFFTEEELHSWYSKVNISDEKELLLSIPFFAKKLKHIAIYYLKLRNKLKNTKLKYNLVGSVKGLELEIKHKLMETFSTLNVELPPEIRNTVVDPDVLIKNLNVEIEELYDDTVYFDKTATSPLSSRINLLDIPTHELFLSKGIELSSDSWVFNALAVPTVDSIEAAVASLTGDIFETTDAQLYYSFLQKYLSENKYITFFNSASTTTITNIVPINVGNNRFFYPSGIVENTLKLDYILDPVPLSSIIPEFGNAANSIAGADTIYVQKGKGNIQGAWLRYKDFEKTETVLEALIKPNQKTSFIFPYPGYGLSSEDISWTGSSLSATYEFDFLSEEYKNATYKAYWDQDLNNDTTDAILINNTLLPFQGSMPSKSPVLADKIFVANQRPLLPLLMPGEPEKGAWLYKFDKTSIPVVPQLFDNNTLVWPYEYISQGSEAFPVQFQTFDFNQICEPVFLRELQAPFAVAGNSFETAEKVYKLSNYNDIPATAIECCWLSGQVNTTGNIQWVSQNGFSALFEPNVPTRFVWTGPDNTQLSSVFGFVSHAEDCQFSVDSSLKDPSQCECKQVYYSAYGHPGNAFADNNSKADYILLDSSDNLDAFDLGSCIDSKGEQITTSTEFAWFKTNTKQGWGDGKWTSGQNGSPFLLKKGVVYIYNRTSSKDDVMFPSYSVSYRFPETGETKWVQCKKSPDGGSWTTTNRESTFVFSPGDLIKWDRAPSTTNYMLSAKQVDNETTSLSSLWCTFDQIALDGIVPSTTVTFPLAYQLTNEASSRTQLPLLSADRFITIADLSRVYWWKFTNTSVQGSTPFYIYDEAVTTFTPKVTGTYVLEVSAQIITATTITTAGIEQSTQEIFFDSNTIPPIYVLPKTRTEYDPVEFKTPTSGFLIEHPLRGWNYASKQYDGVSEGAKPYWATLFLNKDINTKQKGLSLWGYNSDYINGYLPNFSPSISDMQLIYGNVITYERSGGSFIWKQPIIFNTFVGTTEWCKITAAEASFGALSSIYDISIVGNAATFASNEPTDITLTNYSNGGPVEIIYNSMSTFEWALSVQIPTTPLDPITSLALEATSPWGVLTNRFNATVATAPELTRLYSEKDVGGYFTSNYLGASQYINKNFTISPLSGNMNATVYTENVGVHVGGRGVTQSDQETFFTWSEDNRWLKEPPTTNKLTGSVKKNLTKTLQTFVPYNEASSSKQTGINNVADILSPWKNAETNEWIDNINKPTSFTGVHSTESWSKDQISSKEYGKIMSTCVHDIYGTNYGLFTETSENRNGGTLWVRRPNELLTPGYVALSAVFNSIKDLSVTTYKQLTGNEIINIDCFSDTLMFHTPSALIFAKISYDYGTDQIVGSLDDTKYVSLTPQNTAIQMHVGQNWYFPDANKIVCSLTTLSAETLYPELYELDTVSNSFVKQFPSDNVEYETIQQSLSDLAIKTIDSALLTHNSNLHQYLLTITGTLSNETPFITDITIDKRQYYTVSDIKIYKAFPVDSAPYLIGFETSKRVEATVPFSFALSSTETLRDVYIDPTVPLSQFSTLAHTLSNKSIQLSGVIMEEGVFSFECKVSNSGGENIFPIGIDVLPTPNITTLDGEGLYTFDGDRILPFDYSGIV